MCWIDSRLSALLTNSNYREKTCLHDMKVSNRVRDDDDDKKKQNDRSMQLLSCFMWSQEQIRLFDFRKVYFTHDLHIFLANDPTPSSYGQRGKYPLKQHSKSVIVRGVHIRIYSPARKQALTSHKQCLTQLANWKPVSLKWTLLAMYKRAPQQFLWAPHRCQCASNSGGGLQKVARTAVRMQIYSKGDPEKQVSWLSMISNIRNGGEDDP